MKVAVYNEVDPRATSGPASRTVASASRSPVRDAVRVPATETRRLLARRSAMEANELPAHLRRRVLVRAAAVSSRTRAAYASFQLALRSLGATALGGWLLRHVSLSVLLSLREGLVEAGPLQGSACAQARHARTFHGPPRRNHARHAAHLAAGRGGVPPRHRGRCLPSSGGRPPAAGARRGPDGGALRDPPARVPWPSFEPASPFTGALGLVAVIRLLRRRRS